MTRPALSFFLVACASDPAPENRTTAPPQLEPAPSVEAPEEPSADAPPVNLTPGQTTRLEEGRAQAQADLSEGVVQILDFGELPPPDTLDRKTGLPLGSMGSEPDAEMEVWRDAYNDTVLAHVKKTPPFPDDLEILYTVSSWPDGIRHLSIRVTSDAIERHVENLEKSVMITVSERLQLGSLAQSSEVGVEHSKRTPGMYFSLDVQSEASQWAYTGSHPEESTTGLGKLTQLLDTIGSR